MLFVYAPDELKGYLGHPIKNHPHSVARSGKVANDFLEKTRAFYLKCGYDLEARIRDYYTEGDDKVTFRKALK
jgi:hypothetical protein